jgi:FlaG/FlaF family flagellin (archaellin)
MDDHRHWHERRLVLVAITVVLVALFAAWHAGTFDHVLYNVGLNAKPCARNGYGAVFCGAELEEYNHRVEGVRHNLEVTQQEVRQHQREAEADLRQQYER